jgi:hypothetical protein
MTDHLTLIQTVISGVLTGGSAAGTTFLAVFKDIKKRLTDLETKVGNDKTEPKSGLVLAVETLTEQVRKLRREIDSWHEDAPDWVSRAVNRGSRSSFNMETYQDFEQRVDQRLASFARTLKRLEEDLDQREKRLEDEIERSSPGVKVFITRQEYEDDSRRRASETAKIRENLAAANSFLRGVMSALGYIDPEPQPPKPLVLPRKK